MCLTLKPLAYCSHKRGGVVQSWNQHFIKLNPHLKDFVSISWMAGFWSTEEWYLVWYSSHTNRKNICCNCCLIAPRIVSTQLTVRSRVSRHWFICGCKLIISAYIYYSTHTKILTSLIFFLPKKFWGFLLAARAYDFFNLTLNFF